MQSRYARFFQFVIVAGDLLLLNACFLLAGALRFDEIRLRQTEYYDYYVQLIVFFNLSWLFLTLLFRTYQMGTTLEPRKATLKTLNVYFLHLFILLLFLVSLQKDEYSRLFLVYFYTSFLVTVLPWHFFFLRLLRFYRRRGHNFRKVVLVGSGNGLLNFYKTVNERPEFGLKVEAYFSDEPVEGIALDGSEQQLKTYLQQNPVDELYCAYPSGDERLFQWFRLADEYLIRFRIIPDLGLKHSRNLHIDFYQDVPVLQLRKEPLEYVHNRLIKRTGDVALSLLVIILVYPWLMPLLILGVALSGKGPVFFRQKRTGLADDDFYIYKLRSMQVNNKADQEQARAGDKRITPFGRFIRQYHLDELPQFVNVLKGEMSVVGPRPHMISHTETYREIIDQYMLRHWVKPGITGLSQVSGLSGEHDLDQMKKRVETDVYYIENWSVLLDVKIVLDTIWQILSRTEKNKRI